MFRSTSLLRRTVLPLCTCKPQLITPILRPILSRGYAKKKEKSSKSSKVEEEEPFQAGKLEKKGKGKGKSFIEEDTSLDSVGIYEIESVQNVMTESINKLRVSLKSVVGRVGRVSPDLLDGVKVENEGARSPLGEFATVSVKGADLLVTLYDESFMKIVSAALYASKLSITPQQLSSTTLRVPIPRADWDKRQGLVKQAAELCELSRVAIRNSRNKGQKDIKTDLDAKVIGKEEARTEGKTLDTATKKQTDEVDAIFEKAKKVLMDE